MAVMTSTCRRRKNAIIDTSSSTTIPKIVARPIPSPYPVPATTNRTIARVSSRKPETGRGFWHFVCYLANRAVTLFCKEAIVKSR